MSKYFKHLRDEIPRALAKRVAVDALPDDVFTRKEQIKGFNECIVLAGLKGGCVSVSHLQRVGGQVADYGLKVYANNGRCVEVAGTDYRTAGLSPKDGIGNTFVKADNQTTTASVGIFFDRWTGNYYHWFLYCLPKLVLLNKFLGIDKFFLPADLYSLPRFAWESVELLGMNEGTMIPISCGVHQASELYVVHGASPSPLAWKMTRQQFKHVMVACNPSMARAVFLKRKANVHAQRKLVNENEVERMCIQKGIQIFDPGQAPVVEQIRLFNEARVVISLHGAALTNIMWMEPGGKVIEIATDNQPHYLSLAEHFGHEWISLKAKRVDGGTKGHDGLFTVDVGVLEQLIDY